MRTNLMLDDVRPQIGRLMDALYRRIPAGVGTGAPCAAAMLAQKTHAPNLFVVAPPYLRAHGLDVDCEVVTMQGWRPARAPWCRPAATWPSVSWKPGNRSSGHLPAAS